MAYHAVVVVTVTVTDIRVTTSVTMAVAVAVVVIVFVVTRVDVTDTMSVDVERAGMAQEQKADRSAGLYSSRSSGRVDSPLARSRGLEGT